MKKIFKVRWIVVIVLLAAIFGFSGKVEAAPNYKKLYSDVLKKRRMNFLGNSYSYDKFAMVDINRDGKKELIATGCYFRKVHVYTIKKKKVKLLGDIGCFIASDSKGEYIEYNKSSKGLILNQHAGTGLSGYELYKIKKNKLVRTISIGTSSVWDNGRSIVYYSVYQPMSSNSKSLYMKYYNKYFKTGKAKKVYLISNTEGNRKKLK